MTVEASGGLSQSQQSVASSGSPTWMAPAHTLGEASAAFFRTSKWIIALDLRGPDGKAACTILLSVCFAEDSYLLV